MSGRVQVLDHGYIEAIEHWGSDERIVEAARMSTGKGFQGWGPRHADNCPAVLRNVERGDTEIAPEDCRCSHDIPGDEKLLAFLYNNRHATPFEMAGLVIEVQAPIMVFREWHRHRTQSYNEMCLTGDTEITCIGSGGAVRHYTIEHIYRMKHEGVVDHVAAGSPLPPGFTRNGYSSAGTPVLRQRRLKHRTSDYTRVRLLPSCQRRTLRVLDTESELYTTAAMDNVWVSGTKEIWRVETPQGRIVRASADHPFYTREGWKNLSELRPGDRLAANGLVAAMERPVPPSLRSGIGVWTTMMRSRIIRDEDVCYVCGKHFVFDDLELDHVVPVVLDLKKALDESNLKPICTKCHRVKTTEEQAYRQSQTQLGLRWIELTRRPERVGEEMTYDISVKGDHHNFVANGLVVHNSARYVPLPDVNYVPTVERCMVVSATNKQAGAVKGADELTHESVLAWLEELAQVYVHAEQVYQSGLKRGIPKEIARLPVPVGRYSRMRASTCLRNWLAFLTLRSDHVVSGKAAQFEIRQFANEVSNIIKETFPRTHALFVAI